MCHTTSTTQKQGWEARYFRGYAERFKIRQENLYEDIKAFIASEITRAQAEVLHALRIGNVRQWLNEERITTLNKFVTNDEIEIMLDLPAIRKRITNKQSDV